MRTLRRTLLLTLAILLALTLLSLIATTPNRSDDLIADGFEGNAQCQQCLEDALEWRTECFNQYEPEFPNEGDADCNARYDDMVSECQRTACINTQQQARFTPIESTLEQLVPTGECSDLLYCEHAHADCYAKKQAHYKSCKILGGGQWDCYFEATTIYKGCMSAWGCLAQTPL